MKVTYAPVVDRASGKFGGLVASSWKGIDLMRRFASPSQPDTAAQVEIRRIFQNLTRNYTQGPTYFKEAWDSFAIGKAFIGRNVIIRRNVPVLQGQADLTNYVFTPGDASTVPPPTATFTPGVTLITVVPSAPTLPVGWTIERAVAVAIPSFDYGTLQSYVVTRPTEAFDVTSPYSIAITGLSTGSLYRCGTWLIWVAPDGSRRHSASFTGSATPT